MPDADSLKARYFELFGEPTRVAEFTGIGHTFEVLKWDPSVKASDVYLYLTVGLSIGRGTVEDSHCHEFFVGLLPQEDEIARAMAAVVLEFSISGGVPQHGMTITFGKPLWSGSRFSGFVVARQLAAIVPTQLFGPEHVQFLQLLPITPTEAEFIQRNTVDALLAVWESSGVPFWDPRRATSL